MSDCQIDVTKLTKAGSKKLTFKGTTKNFDAYLIPLEQLYYNDLNGRIATYVSQYESEGESIKSLSRDKFNDTIAGFIRNSSGLQRYKETKKDIQANTQKEVGVVLSDGRIIDGNRRFTCLRDLFNETGDRKFAYFEAVVLPAPQGDDEVAWKDIKSLELELQIGTDDKVNYSPIDWLVRVYKDIVKDKSFTEQEYCRLTKLSKTEFKKAKTKAELMEDFLEFFEKPEQFYIAKNLKLDGPLQELAKVRNKKQDWEWDEIKVVFYTYLWTPRPGDTVRRIRDMINLVDTPDFDKLVESAKIDAEKILKGENPNENLTPKSSATLINNKGEYSHNFENEQKSSYDTQVYEAISKKTNEDAKNKPLKCCEDALKDLAGIDKDLVERWNDESMIAKYKKLLSDLDRAVANLKKHASKR